MAETVMWIDVAGTSWLLDNSGDYMAALGRTGAFGPPVNLVQQDNPLRPGSTLLYVKVKPRVVLMPTLIHAQTEAAFATARRNLAWAMNPTRGPGTISIIAADGTQRDLDCYLDAGFDTAVEDASNRGPGWALLPLEFTAVDPYWYDHLANVVSFSPAGAVAFLQNPFLPVHLSPSGLSSSFTVVNNGSIECWPVWTIHGPGTNPSLTNNTTGESIALTITLGSTDVLVIDTRTGIKTVVLNGSTNKYNDMSSTSELFSFATGANNIALSMSGTSSASNLALAYQQRWDGF